MNESTSILNEYLGLDLTLDVIITLRSLLLNNKGMNECVKELTIECTDE